MESTIKETRTLDVLAVAGGLLAVALIALAVYCQMPGTDTTDMDAIRQSLLRRLPNSPTKADLEISTAFSNQIFPKAYKQKAETLRRVVREYPNSALVQLRAGFYGEGKQSVESLHKAAQLDQSNAMPLYLLANEAASRKSWDEAMQLLNQANARRECTWYPLEIQALQTRSLSEQPVLQMAATDFVVYTRLRDLERKVSEHAANLQSTGQTGEALAILAEAKHLGWALIHGKHAETIDVICGAAMVRIALKHQEGIYKAVGSNAGRASVAQEKHKVLYLMAGAKMRSDQAMRIFLNRFYKGFSLMLIIAPLAWEVWFALIIIILAAVLALRSKRKSASVLHFNATTQAFPVSHLLKLYALLFLPIGIFAAIIIQMQFDIFDSISIFVILSIAVLIPSILMHWCANSRYKRAYGAELQAEGRDTPKLWKGVSPAEKREVSRRLAGVHGGAVIFLVVVGLLVSGGSKLALGAFPWQVGMDTNYWHQQERMYVSDLIAGKIIVPESNIRKLER